MKQEEQDRPNEDWNLMLIATCELHPGELLEDLSLAIFACGGWVLSRGGISERCADIDFEFPRLQAVEIYCLLVAAGVELSVEAHQGLTALCQCTRQARMDKQSAAARINLTLYVRQGSESFLDSTKLPQAA